MSFLNDGTNHRTGIANEKATTIFLKEYGHEIWPDLRKGKYSVEHVGGTKTKTDNRIVDEAGKTLREISDKNIPKSNVFTWCNLSAVYNRLRDQKNPPAAVRKMEAFLKRGKKIAESAPMKKADRGRPSDRTFAQRKKHEDAYRAEKDTLCLNFLHSRIIRNLLIECIEEHLIEPNKTMDIVCMCPDGVRRIWPFVNHPVCDLMRDGYKPFLAKTRGHESAKILFEKDGDIQDLRLRLRVHLNNGVNALLGCSRKNKLSSWCVKIQQDGATQLITEIDHIEI